MKNKKEKSPVRKTIALAGNPNSGKTTLFNLLTKSHQHIGNWPGVTVERKEGRYFKDTSLKIVDLPGIYSLTPLSVDEEVAHNYINNDRPDLIIDVVDSTNLERNLFLTSQLLELDIPVVVALNMEDEARAKGIGIDGAALEKVFGCPFFSVSASKNTGVDELMSFCGKEVIKKESALTYFADVESALDKISKAVKIPVNKRWISLKLLEKDSLVTDAACLSPSQTELINGLNAELENKYKNSLSSEIAKQRYDQLNVIACKATRSVARQTADDSDKKQSKRKKSQKNDGLSLSDKIDKVVTNKWLAFPIFAVVMFLVFMISIQTIGGWITSLINDDFTPWFQEWVRSGLDSVSSPQWLSSLVCDGVIAGVLAVVGFVPQIMILFGLIAILEASGYMSRVAFIMDRLCNAIGLSGKSFVSMVVGCGCSRHYVRAHHKKRKRKKQHHYTHAFYSVQRKAAFVCVFYDCRVQRQRACRHLHVLRGHFFGGCGRTDSQSVQAQKNNGKRHLHHGAALLPPAQSLQRAQRNVGARQSVSFASVNGNTRRKHRSLVFAEL